MKNRTWLLTLGIVFFAFLLRAPIAGVGTVILKIEKDLNLPSSALGAITTIQLLSFAMISPFAAKAAQRFGYGRTLFYVIICIGIGCFVRSYSGTAGLFLGTAIIGAGIAFGNVLVPYMIKLKYPEKIGLYTGIFVASMSVAASISSAISVPLSDMEGFGWKNTLSVWCIFAVFCAAIWFVLMNIQITDASVSAKGARYFTIIKNPITWWVTLYFGTQSLLFYIVMTWLPTILQNKGFSASTAGYLFSVYQIFSIPATFICPILASRLKNRGLIGFLVCMVNAFMIMILLVSDNHLVLNILIMVICGFCGSANFSLAMLFISIRYHNSSDTAVLSGFSQSIGYLIAAIGPVMIGAVREKIETYTIPVAILCFISIMLGILSLKAGGRKTID